MKKIAISVGDLNGVGIEIALRAHSIISSLCEPIYCINHSLLSQAVEKLECTIPDHFELHEVKGDFNISEGTVNSQSGQYSFDSFVAAINLAEEKTVDAIVTLPIHKEAWSKAGLDYKGHTDYLREHFKQDAIMMLGCQELYVALFTEHIPLKDVEKQLTKEKLLSFLLNFYHSTQFEKIAVLGLNPHAGDGGVLGNEETLIIEAIHEANITLEKSIFHGPVVPDTAFTPHALKANNRIVAMYHDQGLAPLKALYFDQSINVSLNLPIIRTSVDHGTAFDISYSDAEVNIQSYISAVESAINLSDQQS